MPKSCGRDGRVRAARLVRRLGTTRAGRQGYGRAAQALVDVHRRARPYDLRDDLRRAICVNRQEAVKRRSPATRPALEAMRDFKKGVAAGHVDRIFLLRTSPCTRRVNGKKIRNLPSRG